MRGKFFTYSLFGALLLVAGTVIAKKQDEYQPPRSLTFIENKGQWDNPSVFSTTLPGGQLYIEKNALHFIFHNEEDVRAAFLHPRPFAEDFKSYKVRFHAVRISFSGSTNSVVSSGEEPRTEYYNYFRGNEPRFWQSRVRAYSRVSLQHIYEGIDAVLYSSANGNLKYDLVVKPGSDISRIRMLYQGQESLKLKDGVLQVSTSVNKWVEEKPYAYQWVNGEKQEVSCSFVLQEENLVSFTVGSHDPNLPLIIDPQLIFSTYSGSTVDNFGHSATYDKDGSLYAAGISTHSDGSIPNARYPVTPGAFQQIWGGGVGTWPQASFPCDITISKYTPDGSALIFATYLGGDQNDYPHSLVTDKYDNLVVFGTTLSRNFPTTAGAFDRTHNDSFDIIVSKFSADGTQMIGSTFVGGSDADGINEADLLRMNYADEFRGEVIIDDSNNIVVATSTNSNDFPVTTGAYQTVRNALQEGCVFKLDSNLKTLKASTFIGEANEDAIYSVDLDRFGNIYFAGGTQSTTFPIPSNIYMGAYKGGFSDGFVGKLNSQLTTLQSFRYWGSADYDQAYFVKVDPAGNPVIFGQNYAAVPIINASYHVVGSSLFVTKFKPGLDSILFSTVIGNGMQKNALAPSAFMVDECGVLYGSVWGGGTNFAGRFAQTHQFSFVTSTANLPVSADAVQPLTDNSDFYLFAISRNADSLVYGTYFGEVGGADHVDGGTSRFDKKGIVYQSVCASCSRGQAGIFTTTPNSYSPTNKSPRCSNASFKLDFRKSNLVNALFDFAPRKFCLDSYVVVKFTNNSYNGKYHYWYVNGVLKDTSFHFTDTISAAGTYVVKLVELDSSRCIIIDSMTQSFTTGVMANASFTVFRDTCSPNVTFTSTTVPINTPIKWYFGNGDTSTAHTITRTFPNNGLYQVLLVTNPRTICEDSAIYNLQYDSTSHLMITSFAPRDSFTCEPAHFQLINTSNKINHFKWYINDTFVSTDFVLDTIVFKGRYTVKLVSEDSLTCNKIDSMSFPIRVFPEAFPDFTFSQDVCSLTVQFTNNTLLIPGDTVNYYWQFGNGKTSILKEPLAKFDTAGLYHVSLTINKGLLCEHSLTKDVQVDALPGVLNAFFTAEPEHSCTPAIISFSNLSTNDQTHEWYYNDVLYKTADNFIDTFYTDTTIDVKLIAYNPATCQTSDSIVKTIIIENATLSLFTALRDTCSDLVIFTNQSSSDNNEPLSYTWYFGDGDSSSVTNPTHLYSKDSIYTITLITNRGSFCSDTSESVINYDSLSHLLTANFSLNDSEFCNPAIIRATNLSINGESIQWYLNNILVSSDSIYADTINGPGNYTLKLVATDLATCKKTDSLTKTLNVFQSGTADFDIARDSCSLVVQFKNLSGTPSGLPITYQWYFGDGDSSTETNPLHSYKETNTYTITLFTNAGTPCSDTAMKTFLIDGDTSLEIFIPNVFTPNGDGLNDCYRIKGVSPKCDQYKVKIYNRWGEVYFESTDPSHCWNGKNEAGTNAAAGVYYYIMTIQKRDQEKMEKHGTITLIRD